MTPPLSWLALDAAVAPIAGASSFSVLDLACGGGRHGRCYLERGANTVFVDRDISGVEDLSDHMHAELIETDLEAAPWPLADRRFERVIVTNYLWRPILRRIIDAVAPGGALLYQTFAQGNERFGRPRNPNFLLKEGELIKAIGHDFTIVDAFHGEVADPKPAMIQRIHAIRPAIRRL